MSSRRARFMLRSAAAAVALFGAAASGQTTARWANATSGSWSDSSKWSTSPVVPNNVTASDSYDAVIDAAGNPYSVTVDVATAVSSLTLDSTVAGVDQRFPITLNGPLNVGRGTYSLSYST